MPHHAFPVPHVFRRGPRKCWESFFAAGDFFGGVCFAAGEQKIGVHFGAGDEFFRGFFRLDFVLDALFSILTPIWLKLKRPPAVLARAGRLCCS